MGWLAEKLGWVSAKERQGISVPMKGHWEIDACEGFDALFRALDGWLPEGSVLYFEGGAHSEDIAEFMQEHAGPESAHIEMGTIWPRPNVHHVPASPKVLSLLVELAECHAGPELCVHLHAYRGGEMLLQGFDVFDQELWLPASTPEARVADLAARLGVDYRKSE